MAWTFWPGVSLSRSRMSLGMTTWNFGEIVTVSTGSSDRSRFGMTQSLSIGERPRKTAPADRLMPANSMGRSTMDHKAICNDSHAVPEPGPLSRILRSETLGRGIDVRLLLGQTQLQTRECELKNSDRRPAGPPRRADDRELVHPSAVYDALPLERDVRVSQERHPQDAARVEADGQPLQPVTLLPRLEH